MKYKLKNWYRPGMISLLLLPTALIVYLHYYGYFQQYSILRVFRITADFYKPHASNSVYFVTPPDYQNFVVTLDSNSENNRIKLDYAQLHLRQIIADQDTIRGIYFNFLSSSKYEAFVRVIDLCWGEKSGFFVTMQNNVQAYCLKPEPPSSLIIVPFICGTAQIEQEAIKKQILQERDQQKNEYLLSLWPIWFFFGVYLIIGVFHDAYNLPKFIFHTRHLRQ